MLKLYENFDSALGFCITYITVKRGDLIYVVAIPRLECYTN